MYHLANVLRDRGNFEEAESLHREALGLRRRALGDDHPDTLASMYNLANLLRKQERYAEAEIFYRESLETRMQRGEEAHPHTMFTWRRP